MSQAKVLVQKFLTQMMFTHTCRQKNYTCRHVKVQMLLKIWHFPLNSNKLNKTSLRDAGRRPTICVNRNATVNLFNLNCLN